MGFEIMNSDLCSSITSDITNFSEPHCLHLENGSYWESAEESSVVQEVN